MADAPTAAQAPNVPAPPGQAAPRVPVAVSRSAPSTTPAVRTTLAKVRDELTSSTRITAIEESVRGTVRPLVLSPAVLGQLVNLFTILFQSLWNQGFSQIDPVAAAVAAAQCSLLARNYIHSWMINLYSSVRDSVMKKDPPTFMLFFQTDIGTNGHRYDKFLNNLFCMLHPAQLDASLEETMYVWTFSFDATRAYGNWFDIPNVAVNDLNNRRQRAIIETLDKAKGIDISLPKSGTSLGSGATFLDFYSRDPNTEPIMAVSWLNHTDNFSDTDLTVMFIIGTDFHATRIGPRYTTPPVWTEAARDLLTTPFEAATIEIEDDSLLDQIQGYHADAGGNEVATYAEARTQAARMATSYTRTFWYYRKMHLMHITTNTRELAFLKVIGA